MSASNMVMLVHITSQQLNILECQILYVLIDTDKKTTRMLCVSIMKTVCIYAKTSVVWLLVRSPKCNNTY